MGMMKNMISFIEEDILDGELSFVEIAERYNVDLEFVYEVLGTMDRDDYDDSMDGDHATALSSAGWGTDEDYGYADEIY